MIRGFIYEHIEKENKKDDFENLEAELHDKYYGTIEKFDNQDNFFDTELEEDNIKVDLLNDIWGVYIFNLNYFSMTLASTLTLTPTLTLIPSPT